MEGPRSFGPQRLQELQQRLMELVRSSPAGDLERNLKALLTQTFARMDLVTRDEFEIQQELLRSLRQRVEALERSASSTPPSAGPATRD